MAHPARTPESELARLATSAHGLVTRAALLAAGVTLAEIRHRLDNGALLREHPGVYRVGHRAPCVEAIYLAAVLACGEGALLSGRAAGHLLGLLRGSAPPAEVTAPTERRIRGVRTRRARAGRLALDATTWRGVPVTTVARTLVDLAAQLSEDQLGRACHEAGIRHGTAPRAVEEVLARRPSSPGARSLRRVLIGEVRVTLSPLEATFLEMVGAAGLPLPDTNRPKGGSRVDCSWPQWRLTVEIDGYRYHRSRHAWERDRRREREAWARGDEFRRYTYADIVEAPELMLAELHRLLAPRLPGKVRQHGS